MNKRPFRIAASRRPVRLVRVQLAAAERYTYRVPAEVWSFPPAR